MRSTGTKLAALFVVIVLLLAMTAHQVRFTETAVVTRFSRVQRVIPVDQAGLIFTAPWPIDSVHQYDARLRILTTDFSQLSTEDQKTVTVSAYATWRIADAERFLRAVGVEEGADAKIGDLLKNEISNVLRRHPLADLVNVDPAKMRFDAVEKEVRESVAGQCMQTYGIEVVTVGIQRLGLPESNTREVFERMKADRQKESNALVAEGDARAKQIRADADQVASRILTRSRAYAKKLRAEGDARAAQYFAELQKSEEFSAFLKSLEALRSILQSGKTTIIIDANRTIPFNLLTDTQTKPGAAAAPRQDSDTTARRGE
ncbi:MAG: protease modulator HflC [Phycisphaerae bacterium]